MGRPATKPKQLKDGFYIEIRNKGSKSPGIKLFRDSKFKMMKTIKEYEKAKEVIILGESKNGKWVNDKPVLHEVED